MCIRKTSSAYIPVKDPNSAKAMGRIATKLIETSFNRKFFFILILVFPYDANFFICYFEIND